MSHELSFEALLRAQVGESAASTWATKALVLPDDEVRIRQLAKKLGEYHARQLREHGPSSPIPLHTRAKIFLLGSTLAKREVSMDDAWSEFKNLPQEMVPEYEARRPPEERLFVFLDAAAVVVDYIETGGLDIVGGSGLPID